MNTSVEVPSFYSMTKAGESLSVRAISVPDTSTQIPLGLLTLQDGTVILSAGVTEALAPGMTCFLFDAVTGVYTNLKENNSYTCFLPAGIHEKRFFLVFSKKPSVNIATTEPQTDRFGVAGAGANALLILHTAPGEKVVIRISNTAGQVLYHRTCTQGGNYPVSLRVPVGIYYVSFITSDIFVTKKIFL